MVGARMDLARKDVLNLSAIWQQVQEAIASGKNMLYVHVDLSVIDGVQRYFESYGLDVHTSIVAPTRLLLSWELSKR